MTQGPDRSSTPEPGGWASAHEGAGARGSDRGAETLLSQVERDRLVGRLLDGEASPEDWNRLRELSTARPGLWDELVAFSEDRCLLYEAVDRAGEAAERAEVIDRDEPTGAGPAGWMGWAAAAAVAAAAMVVRLPDPGPADPATANAGLLPASAAQSVDEALNRYLALGREQGRVVEAWPEPLVLETRQLEDQPGVEVVYLRQILERRVIRDAYRLETDEWGRPVAVQEPPTPGLFAPQPPRSPGTVY